MLIVYWFGAILSIAICFPPILHRLRNQFLVALYSEGKLYQFTKKQWFIIFIVNIHTTDNEKCMTFTNTYTKV